MKLDALDLNLLRAFDAVVREGHVSKAAERLGLSQPATSNALQRLRRATGDELFIRAGARMVPTAYGQRLAQAVARAFAELAQATDAPLTFEAQSSDRVFTIAMSDVGEAVFLPPLVQYLQRHAPGAGIRVSPLAGQDLRDALGGGAVDLALGFLPGLKDSIFAQRLFTQRYVLMLRDDHPVLAARPGLRRPPKPATQRSVAKLTAKDFATLGHVVVQADGTGHRVVEQLLDAPEHRRNVALRLPHFLALPFVLRSTNLAATVPEALGQALLTSGGLALTPHPIKLPSFQINQFWHERTQADPACRWLRTAMFGLFGESPQPNKSPAQARG
jgi:DNA-binding transcriptional LysR family regulator